MPYVEGWVVHYVGAAHMHVNPTCADSQALIRNLQADAFGRNYVDFEYNFAVDPCGRIFEGRGFNYQSGANGTTSSNAHAWSVVYLGGPDTPLTDNAKAALSWLTQEGARRKAMCNYVRPHRSVVSTACPGDTVAAYVPFLNEHLHDESTAAPPVTPKKKGHKMFALFRISDAPTASEKAAVWVTDGVTKSWVQTPQQLGALQYIASGEGLPTNVGTMTRAQADGIPIVGQLPPTK